MKTANIVLVLKNISNATNLYTIRNFTIDNMMFNYTPIKSCTYTSCTYTELSKTYEYKSIYRYKLFNICSNYAFFSPSFKLKFDENNNTIINIYNVDNLIIMFDTVEKCECFGKTQEIQFIN